MRSKPPSGEQILSRFEEEERFPDGKEGKWAVYDSALRRDDRAEPFDFSQTKRLFRSDGELSVCGQQVEADDENWIYRTRKGNALEPSQPTGSLVNSLGAEIFTALWYSLSDRRHKEQTVALEFLLTMNVIYGPESVADSAIQWGAIESKICRLMVDDGPEKLLECEEEVFEKPVLQRLIAVDGENFDRQASLRRSLIYTDTLVRRPKKVKRRKTISGIPDIIQKELGLLLTRRINHQSLARMMMAVVIHCTPQTTLH
ncbi:hypothetical protein A6R68_16788 [Neotoma lepida]|uniref:Uncharacterized protein n=1 Tax=Neotoma lepida TaxID=56216 RepID=A0A1A6HGI5_NEOLE|nr:hypothetical protein A6R68_16788 [Neotoma lepida]